MATFLFFGGTFGPQAIKLSLIDTVIYYRGLSLHFNTVLFTYGR
jgi:hypothetical protein